MTIRDNLLSKVRQTFLQCDVVALHFGCMCTCSPYEFCLTESVSVPRYGRLPSMQLARLAQPAILCGRLHFPTHLSNWLGLFVVMLTRLYCCSVQAAMHLCNCSGVSTVLKNGH